MTLRLEGQRGLVQATCCTSARRKYPLGSTCRPAPTPISQEVNFHISNFGHNLPAVGQQPSDPPHSYSSMSRGFSLGDPELPTGPRKCSPEGLEEPRRKGRGLGPSPFAWSSLQAPQVPSFLGPRLPALPGPSCRLLLGVGEWRSRSDSGSLPYPQATFLLILPGRDGET